MDVDMINVIMQQGITRLSPVRLVNHSPHMYLMNPSMSIKDNLASSDWIGWLARKDLLYYSYVEELRFPPLVGYEQ